MKTKQIQTMTDTDGLEVPIKHVQPYDRNRDKKVRAILARWEKTRKAIEDCMAACIKDLNDLQGERAKLPNGDLGSKGNFSVSSFDGIVHVQIKQNYNTLLDDRSRQAREIMLAYAERIVGKIEGMDGAFLSQVITDTFQPTSTGVLSQGKVLKLLRYTIKDKEWERARDLMYASMLPERGKAYLSVGVKPDRQHDPVNIRLDAADCWPRI